ncbi:MAG TPA: hypothetical protein VG297_10710 [Bryobacteraceae bacterium]|nr:hypothetical protein [Bryobacteraceae bacterium]
MSFDLFNLLPALYRLRDAQVAQSLNVERGPLESLLLLIQEQIAVMGEDLDQLYDDQFIETCAPWVIPYIGDLIGYKSIRGMAPAVDNPRAAVAETISFRRRKGTVLVMEQLARDVTGWGAHAVEFFQILADTQYMKHIRPHNFSAPDLRRWQPGLYIDTGFDRTAHKVDVRRIENRRGRQNIQNIGIFLWSMNAYSITKAAAVPSAADPLCFRFGSLGMDMRVFHRALPQGEDITDPAIPANVADRLRRRVLCDDLQNGVGAHYYGETKSLALYLDGKLVNPYQIRVANLSGPDAAWINLPDANSPYAITVDPELGRLALTPPAPGANAPALTTSYFYGFNADTGGGEYERSDTFTVEDPASIFPFPDNEATPRYATLQQALDFATAQFAGAGQVAVEIEHSETYPQPAGLSIALPAGATLELRAADASRPTVLLNGEISVTGARSSTFVINGLLIAGEPSMAPATSAPAALVHVPAAAPDGSPNALSALSILHCTLVPGWSTDTQGNPRHGAAPGLMAEPAGLRVEIQKSIVGAVRAGEFVEVCGCDSVIDATSRTLVAYAGLDGASAGGALTLQGCTVVGNAHASLLPLVSNTIFWAAISPRDAWATPLIADRRQEGCVRFSFLPAGAKTPRRFECVEEVLAGPQPVFFTTRYGAAGYSKLLPDTPDAIRRGADDGGEMGAFHFVLAPLRESDLRVRMEEFIPAGLEFGIIYQN